MRETREKWTTLRNLRDRTGSAVCATATAGAAPLKVVVALVLGLLLILGARFVLTTEERPQPAAGAADRVGAEAHPSARTTRAPDAVPSSRPPVDSGLMGRLLTPDGTPVRGARLKLEGWRGDPGRADVQIESDEDGRFFFPRTSGTDGTGSAHNSLTVVAPPWADGRWTVPALRDDDSGDLGDLVLEPPGTVVVRVVDSSGAPLTREWSVEGTSAPESQAPARGPQRLPFSVSGRLDGASGEFVLEGLPAGRVELVARLAQEDTIGPRSAVVRAWDAVDVELPYAGAPIERSITVQTRSRPFRGGPRLEHVKLRGTSGETITAQRVPRSTSRFVFEGLAEDTYSVEVDDPQFLPWSKSGIYPGELVQAQLTGSATLVLDVRDGDRGGSLERYELTAAIEIPDWTPTFRRLLAAGDAPPAGGIYPGFVSQAIVLSVRAEGFADWTTTLPGFAPGETRAVVAELTRGKTLRGKVVARDGLPIAEVAVELTRGELAGHSRGKNTMINTRRGPVSRIDESTRTDATGAFAFEELAPGEWTVRAVWSPWVVTTETITIERTDSDVTLDAPPAGFLSGSLVLPNAGSVDDVELTFLLPSGAEDSHLRGAVNRNEGLNADGSFRAGPLPVGEVEVKLSVLVTTPGVGTRPTLGSISLGSVAIEPGENEHAFDLRESYPGRIRATVRIDGEQVLGGVRPVRLPGYELRGWSGRGGRAGTYLIGGLAPGPWSVRYTAQNGAWTWTHPGPLEVGPGGETDVELDIALSERRVRFVDDAGAPLANERVTWSAGPPTEYVGRESERQEAALRTDREGWLTLALPVGSSISFTTSVDGRVHTFLWDESAPEPLIVTLDAE